MPSLPSGSCLWVRVQEDIQCEAEDCDIPTLGEQNFEDISLDDSRAIAYKVNFKAAQSNQYLISATVNMGWCRSENSNNWIRIGDYHNEYSHSFVVPSTGSTAVKDVEVYLYADASKASGILILLHPMNCLSVLILR